MPPRQSALTDRSPVCVSRWDDDAQFKKKGTVPLVKSVSFAEHNEVFEIWHINDFPDQMIADIWYDGEEYAEIKGSYQSTIFMMEAGHKLDEKEDTARGLEYRTQDGAWARHENKRDAYNLVLDEQDRQWKYDKDDWNAIAEKYLEVSVKCIKAANERGLQDELDVADYLKDVPIIKKIKKKKPKELKELKELKENKEKKPSKGEKCTKKNDDEPSSSTLRRKGSLERPSRQ
ncbi:hypothetical protein FisN_6Hu201 [Fistulifera solaris]|uniref:Uncharacterized protein n=1 Tax=Fistulifera solaris TaxID=1519565 RepID=A0A1Z5KEV3_FISSO|nr:hypothetical protein FisN_6Hu201 [Fistulifera solaris]|eukprot:GAX24850.1 hypothetical protein FisN_6Hu201 [Fistulifera solaris]